MSDAIPCWFLQGQDNKPSGPFTPEQALERLRQGLASPQTLCWREGMTDWLPMNQVQPFATVLKPPVAAGASPLIHFQCRCGSEIVMAQQFAGRQARCKSCGRTVTVPGAKIGPSPTPMTEAKAVADRPRPLRRIVRLAVLLIILGAVGFAAYYVIAERLAISKAKGLIAAGDYSAAAKALAPMTDRTYHTQEVTYLLAVSRIDDFASDTETQDADADALRRPRTALKEIVDGAGWRERAVGDLAGAIDLVPAKAPDVAARTLALARLLEDLKIVDGKQLAASLLKKSKSSPGGASARLAPEVAEQVLAWNPALAGELVAADMLDGSAGWGGAGLQAVSKFIRESPTALPEIGAGLIAHADKLLAADNCDAAERLLEGARFFDPKRAEQVDLKRLAVVDRRLKLGNAEAAARLLRQIPTDSDALRRGAARLHRELARQLPPPRAAEEVELAARLDPEGQSTEEAELTYLDAHPQVDQSKLGHYRKYMTGFPTGQRRAEVLLRLVQDAAKAGSPDYLEAAQAAAEELLAKYRKAESLDARVYELAKRLAERQNNSGAVKLAESLLAAAPDTPMKLELSQQIIEWRKGMGAVLPPDLDQARTQVEAELKVFTLTTPGALKTLMQNPRSVQVVQVALQCRLDNFNSEERAMLQEWVRGGGVAWVNNDVLEIFSIQSRGADFFHRRGNRLAISAALCPIVTGCERAQVTVNGNGLINLQADTVVPLVVAENGDTLWSLVPYGKGWVSNVPDVDEKLYDGARCWLNFRLFCLGRPIPEASRQTIAVDGLVPPVRPGQSPAARVEEPTLVTSTGELTKVLPKLNAQRVMWIQLTRKDVSDEIVKQLRAWIEDGGVLWLDTDLASKFGFPLASAPAAKARGTAKVTEAKHPITEGLPQRGEVGYVLSSDHLYITGTWTILTRTIVPLLGWEADKKTVVIVMAVREQGRGQVIFRPRTIEATGAYAKKLEANLRAFSFSQARQPTAETAPAGAGK